MNKYLVVGLGNIGQEYKDTRHNIGFDIIEYYASILKSDFQPNKYGSTIKFKIKGRPVTLLKPSTYVNLSGKAVSYYVNKENIKPENILIIADDLNLPFGKFKIKTNGRSGGHNGIENIIKSLDSFIFPRLKFGIGSDFLKGNQINFVLGKWTKNEKEIISKKLLLSKEIIDSFVFKGIGPTMNKYNSK